MFVATGWEVRSLTDGSTRAESRVSNCDLASYSDWTIDVLRHDWNASCSARRKTACDEVMNMVNEKRLAENYDNIKNLGLLTFASLFSVFRGKNVSHSCHM